MKWKISSDGTSVEVELYRISTEGSKKVGGHFNVLNGVGRVRR
jgi:hypothetical protein